MEDVTLSWPGSMTTDQAKKYLLTAGFVAVELFRDKIRKYQKYKHFVNHIEEHLQPGQVVICKICGRSVDEIAGLGLSEQKPCLTAGK